MFDLPCVDASLIFTKDRRHQKDKEDAVVFHCLVHRLCKILETMQKDSVQSVSWQNIQERRPVLRPIAAKVPLVVVTTIADLCTAVNSTSPTNSFSLKKVWVGKYFKTSENKAVKLLKLS